MVGACLGGWRVSGEGSMRGKGDIGNTLNKKERELRGMESLLKIEKMKKTFFKN